MNNWLVGYVVFAYLAAGLLAVQHFETLGRQGKKASVRVKLTWGLFVILAPFVLPVMLAFLMWDW